MGDAERTVCRLLNHRAHPKDNVQLVTVEGLLRVAVVTKRQRPWEPSLSGIMGSVCHLILSEFKVVID